MSFNPGASSSVDDKNLFVPEETNRIELETEVVKPGGEIVAIYTMVDEDYGIGHLLRQELQLDPLGRILFAACRVPHPQEAVMQLRFHLKPKCDAQTVLNEAIERCIRRIDRLSDELSIPSIPQLTRGSVSHTVGSVTHTVGSVSHTIGSVSQASNNGMQN